MCLLKQVPDYFLVVAMRCIMKSTFQEIVLMLLVYIMIVRNDCRKLSMATYVHPSIALRAFTSAKPFSRQCFAHGEMKVEWSRMVSYLWKLGL